MSANEPFSPEYAPTKGTVPSPLSGITEQRIEVKLEAEIKKEMPTYGTGKPKRTTITARILHD